MDSPPHSVKEQIVLAYAKRYGIEIFIETGTFRGAMVQAVQHAFKHVYSIELDHGLYADAHQRFANLEHVQILHGFSSFYLRQICPTINKPILFWLDAHYSGEGTARGLEDTPIFEELDIISRRNQRDVILIDDARLFGSNGWPSLDDLIASLDNLHREMTIQDDIIRIVRSAGP